MKVLYRQAASDDVVRQFQYYFIDQNVPDIAMRFRDAVRNTVESLRQHPSVGAHYRSSSRQLDALRSWPVAGFELIRIYYLIENDTIRVVRILHGKRDVKHILTHQENI